MDVSQRFYEFTPAAHFLVTDEDAADFLQSQFTNELRPFEPGQATYGLFLDVKGKVIADSIVLCEDGECFRVLSERCPGERIVAQLERHIIADDVVIETVEAGLAFELAAEGLQTIGLPVPEVGHALAVENGRVIAPRPAYYIVHADSAEAAAAWREQLTAAGWQALSEDERGLARIKEGRPLIPEEIGESDLPGEGALESDAVSFTKGCYLGQEVVARMHNIGKPQRGLFIVEGKGAVPELPNPLSNNEGKVVGELRTAYKLGDGWRGLAILKTRFAQSGSVLALGGNEIRVAQTLREGRADV